MWNLHVTYHVNIPFFTNLIIEWLVGGFNNLCLSCLIVYSHTNHRTDISSSQLTALYNPYSNLTNQINAVMLPIKTAVKLSQQFLTYLRRLVS